MEKSLFKKWCSENWTATYKTMKLANRQPPHTKVNLNWLKGLNVILDTINLLKENTSRIL